AEGPTEAHGVLDRGAVDDRQRARQAEADRADVGVRLRAEDVAAAAEQLRLGRQLDVDLEADDDLPPFDDVTHGAAPSSTAAARNIVASSSELASTWMPTGRPSSPVPNGTDIDGWPARFDGIVQMSLRYMVSGSPVFSPSGNAVVGVVGEISRSKSS